MNINNFIFCFLLFALPSNLNNVFAFPSNKYCAQNNIFGFKLNLTFFDNNFANISAYIPFKTNGNIHCNNEKYTFKGDKLYFTSNQSDCLNANLKKYNACPCPPNISFNSNKNLFNINSVIGVIPLDSC